MGLWDYPKNKKKFLNLILFGKEIIKICRKVGITPVVYGSFAYFIYTKDKKIKVNDLDFYISERYFQKIIDILDKNKIRYNYDKKWRTIQIYHKELKVELDSIEKYRSHHFKRYPNTNFDFYGLKVKILNLKSLKKVYQRASIRSDKREKNRKKYESLLKIK